MVACVGDMEVDMSNWWVGAVGHNGGRNVACLRKASHNFVGNIWSMIWTIARLMSAMSS